MLRLKSLLSHSKSFNVNRNYTDDQGVCKVLLVINGKPKYVSILYRYWHSKHRILTWPWNLG